MSLSRDSRQERKLKSFRRAEFGLKQRMEKIDWEEDTLYPEVADLKAGKSVLGLLPGVAFDIQIDVAPATPDVAPGAASTHHRGDQSDDPKPAAENS